MQRYFTSERANVALASENKKLISLLEKERTQTKRVEEGISYFFYLFIFLSILQFLRLCSQFSLLGWLVIVLCKFKNFIVVNCFGFQIYVYLGILAKAYRLLLKRDVI